MTTNRQLAWTAAGVTLIAGALTAYVHKEVSDERSNVRKTFQAATTEQQFQSIKRGIAYVTCIDEGTGTSYEPKEVTAASIEREALIRNGCSVQSYAPRVQVAP